MSVICIAAWLIDAERRKYALIKLTTIGSENGLLSGRRPAIFWTNDRILLHGPLGTNISEILLENDTFSIKTLHLKMSSGKCRPFCLGLNVITEVLQQWWFDPMWLITKVGHNEETKFATVIYNMTIIFKRLTDRNCWIFHLRMRVEIARD